MAFDSGFFEMEADTSSPPSLGRSNDSTVDSSGPETPSDRSPFLAATMSAMSIEPVSLSHRPATPTQDAVLPDILDPDTASKPIRRICCIGAGYVGGPTAAVIALHNPHVRVTVVDRDEKRIAAWKSRHLPIHEPGIEDVVRLARDGGSAASSGGQLLAKSERRRNLFFSTACTQTIADADMVFISVNTSTKRHGAGAGRATDMAAVEGATRDVATHARPGTIVVEKSTVPCKTGQLIKDILQAHRPGVEFPVLSNPEFLAEGTAIRDLMNPDRVVIGCESTLSGHRAAAALANLYAVWVRRPQIVPINIWSSELCKLAANAMLAQRISSINSISAICEKTGADVGEIAQSIGMDRRIGPQFLKAGLGFGGSCFRKDVASLTYLAESLGEPEVAEYWQRVLDMNNFQRDRFTRKVIAKLNNSLRGKKIAILGYAFKKDTGDARESPALDVVRLLLEEDPRSIAIYDPLCREADIKRELRVLEGDDAVFHPEGSVKILSDPYDACAGSDAVLVLTEWDMFKLSKPAPTPTKPASSPFALGGLMPSDFLAAVPPPQPKPTTPPKTSSLPPELAHRLRPEPSCPLDCQECAEAEASGSSVEKDAITPLDWTRISRSVKEPRWVFDGRGILDPQAMRSLGFRLEAIGRASEY